MLQYWRKVSRDLYTFRGAAAGNERGGAAPENALKPGPNYSNPVAVRELQAPIRENVAVLQPLPVHDVHFGRGKITPESKMFSRVFRRSPV